MKHYKKLDIALTFVSALYLVVFIVTLIVYRVNNKNFDIFSFDGLTVLGALFSLLELIASNRNWLSKNICQMFFFNRFVNYQIGISIEDSSWDINQIVENLEESIKLYFGYNELERRLTSSMKSSKWTVIYKNLGLEVECVRNNFDYFFSQSDEINKVSYILRITGHSKFGKIATKRIDTLYFSSLVKIISHYYLADSNFIQNNRVQRIDVIIKKDSSQIKQSNLFNENVGEIKEYWIKTVDMISDNEEIEITKDEIKWSSLDSRAFLDGFERFTELLCYIE